MATGSLQQPYLHAFLGAPRFPKPENPLNPKIRVDTDPTKGCASYPAGSRLERDLTPNSQTPFQFHAPTPSPPPLSPLSPNPRAIRQISVQRVGVALRPPVEEPRLRFLGELQAKPHEARTAACVHKGEP